jgi:hypothetical protein
LSTASRDAGQRPTQRTRPKLSTLLIGAGVLVVVLVTMVLASGAFGIWPPKPQSADTFKPTAPHAANVAVEIVGIPVAMTQKSSREVEVQLTKTIVTDTLTTVTVTVKITNNVMQSPPPTEVVGTPPVNPPTPAAEPAKILNASIKVLFYNKDNKLVGSGVGYYYNPQGLDYQASANVDIVASDVEGFDPATGIVKAYVDNLLTDKDPVKTPAPAGVSPAQIVSSLTTSPAY